MGPRATLSIWRILSILAFGATAFARHVHPRHIQHRHHIRQDASPVFQTQAISSKTPDIQPSPTGGNESSNDIQDIQDRLPDLQGDIRKFVHAIEDRLSQLESILEILLATSTTTTTTTLHSMVSIPSSTTCTTSALPTETTSTTTITSTSTSTDQYTITTYLSTNETTTSSTTLSLSTDFRSAENTSSTAVTVTVQYASETAQTTASTATSSSQSQSPSPTPYTFNPDAPDNVAVYYGQTPNTQAGGLLALCENPNVDIVILAFVFDFFGPQGFPTIDFGPGCTAPNVAQSEQAPGLKDCTVLAAEIDACQGIGKKVLVSLGGYIANSAFVSDNQASHFAETLWNLFGAGTGENPDIRPFGRFVTVDGFDIDNENHNSNYYDTFATTLRQCFAQDPSKTYYLSAAPQCPMPDESIPFGAMAQADFVWVQFYNNPQCNLDSPGFQASFEAWSTNLTSSNAVAGRPRIYIGTWSFDGGGSGYIPGSGLSTRISLARQLDVQNFGGIMLWDGSQGQNNVDQDDISYLEYAKAALQ